MAGGTGSAGGLTRPSSKSSLLGRDPSNSNHRRTSSSASQLGPPLESSTMPPPEPRKQMPKLEDFYFIFDKEKKHLPSTPPETCKTDEEFTIHAVHRLLQLGEHESDIALDIMIKRKAIMRHFKPRGIVNSNGAAVAANWKITNQARANAMAFFLLDKCQQTTRCSTCDHPNSQAPFSPCLVPTVWNAEGACVNCIFMNSKATCEHRLNKIKKEEILEYPIFTKFEREDLEAATEEQLKEWSLRLRNEINSRRTNTVEEKTPRGRKRMQED